LTGILHTNCNGSAFLVFIPVLLVAPKVGDDQPHFAARARIEPGRLDDGEEP